MAVKAALLTSLSRSGFRLVKSRCNNTLVLKDHRGHVRNYYSSIAYAEDGYLGLGLELVTKSVSNHEMMNQKC